MGQFERKLSIGYIRVLKRPENLYGLEMIRTDFNLFALLFLFKCTDLITITHCSFSNDWGREKFFKCVTPKEDLFQ